MIHIHSAVLSCYLTATFDRPSLINQEQT